MASATHQKSVQIKPHGEGAVGGGGGGVGGGVFAKPGFDWGPLPGVKPATSLAADLRTPAKMGR